MSKRLRIFIDRTIVVLALSYIVGTIAYYGCDTLGTVADVIGVAP